MTDKRCPCCHGSNIYERHIAKSIGSSLGAVGGGAVGAAGMWTGLTSGAETGLVLGAKFGPAGAGLGTLAGATIGCLMGAVSTHSSYVYCGAVRGAGRNANKASLPSLCLPPKAAPAFQLALRWASGLIEFQSQ